MFYFLNETAIGLASMVIAIRFKIRKQCLGLLLQRNIVGIIALISYFTNDKGYKIMHYKIKHIKMMNFISIMI